ncbi:hypothetical protein BgiMline_027081 [Biomphalaria glabrata]
MSMNTTAEFGQHASVEPLLVACLIVVLNLICSEVVGFLAFDFSCDGTVTRQELVRFFTLQNLKASGLSVQAETLDFTGNNRSHRMIGGFVIVLIVALQSGLRIL